MEDYSTYTDDQLFDALEDARHMRWEYSMDREYSRGIWMETVIEEIENELDKRELLQFCA